MTIERDSIVAVVGGVIRQALADFRADGVVVLEAMTPEGRLVVDIAASSIGRDRVHEAEPAGDGGTSPVEREEMERMAARVKARTRGFMLAHPANKTILLLGSSLPPEPLLPPGDLHASEISELAGGATLSAELQGMADSAGGVEALDGMLAMWSKAGARSKRRWPTCRKRRNRRSGRGCWRSDRSGAGRGVCPSWAHARSGSTCSSDVGSRVNAC